VFLQHLFVFLQNSFIVLFLQRSYTATTKKTQSKYKESTNQIGSFYKPKKMITEDRLKWLQQNKQRGDVAQVVRMMNPKNNKKGITYNVGASIINGNLWGKWGAAFTENLEKYITDRNKRIEEESKKYSKKLIA
jgi:hypothetical protein